MRAPSVDKNGIKKGTWTEEEDNKLRDYILRYGHWNWRLLPKFAGLARCGKSCRLRWVNYLKPGVKRGNFSRDEEDLIAKLHHELGNKWSAIAAKLPGRTDNEIKNYWHTHLKKKRSKITPKVSQNSVCNNSQEASLDANSETMNFSRKYEDFQASDIPILESLESNSWSRCPVICDTEDCASTSRSVQEIQGSFLSEEKLVAENSDSRIEFFEDRNDEKASSSGSFDGFEEDFWSEPYIVDNSYSQDESFLPLLDDGVFFFSLFSHET